MKITVDIDCTPQEARTFMGLPDLEPLHATYLDRMKRNIEEGITADSLQSMLKSWAPMGEAGMMLWKQLSDQMGKASTKK
ncbi:DUF6489 family protein [Sphingomonas montana]|uniref:DUF6489 family protein n=1 Tax=Sphingomonas montana TaxID=1843236 RepID=UPI00096CA305|nr:DUF6489 family protein [Sphingomonas montana]